MKWFNAASAHENLDAAELARQALGWAGVTLPAVRMSGGAVLPVVAWTASAASRWVFGPAPEPCRATLMQWESYGPSPAVHIAGFIHVGPAAAGIDRLKAVSAYGPGALVVRNVRRVSAWTMAEADVAGLSVVQVLRNGQVDVTLEGRRGPLTSARRTVATRLREEQLFEWALRVGAEPRTLPLTGKTLVS